MIKKLRMSCLGMLLALGGLCIYGNVKIKHLDFDKYINDPEIMYSIIPPEYTIDYMLSLNNIIIDDMVNSYSDILDNSANVLKVKIVGGEFAGRGLINNCLVEKVIKSDAIKKGDKVKIYSHLDGVSNLGPTYFDGSLPLVKGESYIVSIDKAPNPNVSGSYMFNSFKYGFFKLKENPRYLSNFEQKISFSLKDAMEYEYITIGDDISLYDSIYKEVNELYK